jgi:hypothetical protein
MTFPPSVAIVNQCKDNTTKKRLGRWLLGYWTIAKHRLQNFEKASGDAQKI